MTNSHTPAGAGLTPRQVAALRMLVAQGNRIAGDAMQDLDGTVAVPDASWDAFVDALDTVVDALDVEDAQPSGILAFDGGALHIDQDGGGRIVIPENQFALEDDRDEGPNGPHGGVHWVAHLPAAEVAALRGFLSGHTRPTDDDLWDKTLRDRDEYHDMADRLAQAIADHLLVEIGEHSSSNCPWMRALEAIESAPSPEEPGVQPQQAEGWTGNTDADAALVMLDRLDVEADDDERVSAIAATLRSLALASQRNTIDAAFEAVRKRMCALPRYSFLLGPSGNGVRRVVDRSGNWIEFDAAHALFDPVAVDAARQRKGDTA